MNYTYDVLLNFKDEYYDFYDWNKNDNIYHIRKIPLIKIDKNDICNIKNNYIKLDEKFLKIICNKTELFTTRGIKNIKYACLFTDGEDIFGINVKDKKIKISSLLIDESLDILEESLSMDTYKINYEIENKKEDQLKTRKQLEIEKFLKKEISKIKNNEEKLMYLYYECFNEQEKDINKIVIDLSKFDNQKVIDKMYSFFKLIEIKK